MGIFCFFVAPYVYDYTISNRDTAPQKNPYMSQKSATSPRSALVAINGYLLPISLSWMRYKSPHPITWLFFMLFLLRVYGLPTRCEARSWCLQSRASYPTKYEVLYSCRALWHHVYVNVTGNSFYRKGFILLVPRALFFGLKLCICSLSSALQTLLSQRVGS